MSNIGLIDRDSLRALQARHDELLLALRELTDIMAATGDHVVYSMQWSRAKSAIEKAVSYAQATQSEEGSKP